MLRDTDHYVNIDNADAIRGIVKRAIGVHADHEIQPGGSVRVREAARGLLRGSVEIQPGDFTAVSLETGVEWCDVEAGCAMLSDGRAIDLDTGEDLSDDDIAVEFA